MLKKNFCPKLVMMQGHRKQKSFPLSHHLGPGPGTEGAVYLLLGFVVVVVLISPQQQLGNNSKSHSPGFLLQPPPSPSDGLGPFASTTHPGILAALTCRAGSQRFSPHLSFPRPPAETAPRRLLTPRARSLAPAWLVLPSTYRLKVQKTRGISVAALTSDTEVERPAARRGTASAARRLEARSRGASSRSAWAGPRAARARGRGRGRLAGRVGGAEGGAGMRARTLNWRPALLRHAERAARVAASPTCRQAHRASGTSAEQLRGPQSQHYLPAAARALMPGPSCLSGGGPNGPPEESSGSWDAGCQE